MEGASILLLTDNPLVDKMCIKCGNTMWEEFCLESLSEPTLPINLVNLYNMITNWKELSMIARVLDTSRKFQQNSEAAEEARLHSNLLHLLATNGYGGGGLLKIVHDIVTALMEDPRFSQYFPEEPPAEPPSRNTLKHAIHKNVGLALKISILGFILQKVDVDIITIHVEITKDMCLEFKLLYQQDRIREYRPEPLQITQKVRRGQARTTGEVQAKVKACGNGGNVMICQQQTLMNILTMN